MRWLDIATCAAAERHAGHPCVTGSVLDLVFEVPTHEVLLGDLIVVTATPVRTGTTSIDIYVTATSERYGPGSSVAVASAFFLYVAIRNSDGSKFIVPQLGAVDGDEELEWLMLLGAERRRIKAMASRTAPVSSDTGPSEPAATASGTTTAVSSAATAVEALELALPLHQNHMQHNFGGQIMSWMLKIATVCVHRHVGRSKASQPFTTWLTAVADLSFENASDTADHLLFSAVITRCFGSEVEVAVTVTKQRVGGAERIRINQGFLHFGIGIVNPVEDGGSVGRPAILPHPAIAPVVPDNGCAMWSAAARRRRLLRLRRQLLSFTGGPLDLGSGSEAGQLIEEAAFLSVMSFRRSLESAELEWTELPSPRAARAEYGRPMAVAQAKRCWGTSIQAVRITATLKASPAALYRILHDITRWPAWDPGCASCDLLTPARTVDRPGTESLSAVLASVALQFGKTDPSVRLRLLRAEAFSEESGTFVLASRSVATPEALVPSRDESPSQPFRVQPSGWHLAPTTGIGEGSVLTFLIMLDESQLAALEMYAPLNQLIARHCGAIRALDQLACGDTKPPETTTI